MNNVIQFESKRKRYYHAEVVTPDAIARSFVRMCLVVNIAVWSAMLRGMDNAP